VNKCQTQLSQSRLQIKLKQNINKTIPFAHEIPNLIEVAHNGFQESNASHNGIKMTLKNLGGLSMLFYWAGMMSDIQNYVESCSEYIQGQPIIPEGPFDRFTADLWTIPNEMLKVSGTQYRYVLSCIDRPFFKIQMV